MIKSTSPTQLTLLPQPDRRSGPHQENHSALRSAPSPAQPSAERTRSRPLNPVPRTAPAKKSRQSLWYCLYLPQLSTIAADEQREPQKIGRPPVNTCHVWAADGDLIRTEHPEFYRKD